MRNDYVGFEVRRPANSPTENGEYYGKTPVFEQALGAAKSIGGALYGITASGEKVFICY